MKSEWSAEGQKKRKYGVIRDIKWLDCSQGQQVKGKSDQRTGVETIESEWSDERGRERKRERGGRERREREMYVWSGTSGVKKRERNKIENDQTRRFSRRSDQTTNAQMMPSAEEATTAKSSLWPCPEKTHPSILGCSFRRNSSSSSGRMPQGGWLICRHGKSVILILISRCGVNFHFPSPRG